MSIVLLFVAAVALPLGVDAMVDDVERSSIAEAEAREVVAEFFRTLNARDYDTTCALLADRYFAREGSERRNCAIGLRVGFLWSQEVRWRITAVRVEGHKVIVDTIADGAPGTLVLVRSALGLRVLAVEGG
jgi:hypothetical protein